VAIATTKIPGKILLQIRDGVPNVLSEFEIDVRVGGTRPIAPDEPHDPEAKLSHDASVNSLIEGLYSAIIPLGQKMLDAQESAETRAKVATWLREMSEWALHEAGIEQ